MLQIPGDLYSKYQCDPIINTIKVGTGAVTKFVAIFRKTEIYVSETTRLFFLSLGSKSSEYNKKTHLRHI